MNGKVIVEGNTEVTIKRIMQWHTYDGLLEGLPTKRMNESILSQAKDEAKKICMLDQIYLIEPVQTSIPYEGKYAMGDPYALPIVTCIAELWYCFPFRDKEKDYSSLAVIWFQQEYAFPIDADIIEKIKEIPFSKICGEFMY